MLSDDFPASYPKASLTDKAQPTNTIARVRVNDVQADIPITPMRGHNNLYSIASNNL